MTTAVLSLEEQRQQFANAIEQFGPHGISADDVYAVARFQHEIFLDAIAHMPPEERAKTHVTWTDESQVEHDCLVPFDQAPEQFRLATQTQIAASALLFIRAGFKFVRVQ